MLDLVKIAEEVEATRTARELKRENKTAAVITPVAATDKAKKPKAKTNTAYEAFLTSLGSWKEGTPEEMIAQVYRAREEGTRPATRP